MSPIHDPQAALCTALCVTALAATALPASAAQQSGSVEQRLLEMEQRQAQIESVRQRDGAWSAFGLIEHLGLLPPIQAQEFRSSLSGEELLQKCSHAIGALDGSGYALL